MSQRLLCRYFGHSPQGLRKNLLLRQKRKAQAEAAIAVARCIRQRQPRVGTRKMHREVNRQLLLKGYAPLGRDRLFDALAERNMLVKPTRQFVRTTDSYHRFRVYRNLLKQTVQTGPNQAWAADITYLRLVKGFCYLFLITDMYSRKIVGYHVSKDLGVEGALKALRMALAQCSNPVAVIHHSDRGIQYCCDAYVGLLAANKMHISMTEQNHCYENAKAERVNETLKYDLMLGLTMPSYAVAQKATDEAIEIYNNERWHEALGYITPALKHAA